MSTTQILRAAPIKNQVMWSVVRHLLTTVAGMLAAKGTIEGGDVEALIGGVMLLLGVAWSAIEKKIAAKKAHEHVVSAVAVAVEDTTFRVRTAAEKALAIAVAKAVEQERDTVFLKKP